MAAPFNRIRSKLNRAIVAYLIQKGCGTAADTFPENSQAIKGYPVTTVRAGVAIPEPVLTGNRRVDILITVKGQALKDPNKPDDISTARVAFDNRLALVGDALTQSDDGRTLRATAVLITAAGRALAVSDPEGNADMADFTVMLWLDAGEGDVSPDEQGTAWQEGLKFSALCAPSNVD